MKKLNSNWEEPNCNLCGGSATEIIYNNMTYWEYPGKFRIVRCRKCSLVFTSPRPVLSRMEKYYESEMYFGRDVEKKDCIDDSEGREMHYGPMYEIILSKKKKGSIFDIGAGTGMLLSKFKDKGWRVSGVELTRGAVNYAKRKYKIKLYQGDFLEKKVNDTFDVIVLNGALEHLHQPFETLLKARKNLKNKGFVLISIPNSDSLGRKIFGKNWFAWQPPRHLHHFAPKTVSEMLNKAGYKNINISHSYSVQNNYILFQSARYMLSPKFKKKSTGGLINQKDAFVQKASIKKNVGKYFFKTFAFLLSKIEPLIKRGEVMIIYAEK